MTTSADTKTSSSEIAPDTAESIRAKLQALKYEDDVVNSLGWQYHGLFHRIHIAAKMGEVQELDSLLKAGFDPNLLTKHRPPMSALTLAVQYSGHSTSKYLECMKLLLDSKALPDGHPRESDVTLVIAIRENQFDAFKLLLDCGADPYRERGGGPNQSSMKRALSHADKFPQFIALIRDYETNRPEISGKWKKPRRAEYTWLTDEDLLKGVPPFTITKELWAAFHLSNLAQFELALAHDANPYFSHPAEPCGGLSVIELIFYPKNLKRIAEHVKAVQLLALNDGRYGWPSAETRAEMLRILFKNTHTRHYLHQTIDYCDSAFRRAKYPHMHLTVLDLAIMGEEPEMVRILLENGAVAKDDEQRAICEAIMNSSKPPPPESPSPFSAESVHAEIMNSRSLQLATAANISIHEARAKLSAASVITG